MRFRIVDSAEERRAIQKWIRTQRKRLFTLMCLGKHDEHNKTLKMIEQAEQCSKPANE